MSRLLIILGIIVLLIGLAWPILKKIGLGHLPGDLIIKRDTFTIYIPITTCIIISLVISLILWILNR